MRIYFSGGGGLVDTPEVLLPHAQPHVMLTFHQLYERQSSSLDRLKAFIRGHETAIYGSMFVDSGAHSLYNIHVLKLGKRVGTHGRELAKLPTAWSQGDFSYYDLRKGSPFRRYCNSYAKLISKMAKRDIILANVDVISNPDLTWEVQRFFEEEHGVQPMPIVHCETPMKYVDRYIESGRYDLLGVGGLGQGISKQGYLKWGHNFFHHICPESNKRKPIIRTHGFAMTSWELMCMWPWWSVDSATWVKLSAYGWLYVPRWSDKRGLRFDCPPYVINFSERSPQKDKRAKHYDNSTPVMKKACEEWLKQLGVGMGKVDSEGKVVEMGVAVHHRPRSRANLSYLVALQNSRPKWPHVLDNKESGVTKRDVAYSRGMGL